MIVIQIREPYSAVRFLAEHVELEKILDLKPRTQLFDGIEEELVPSPHICMSDCLGLASRD